MMTTTTPSGRSLITDHSAGSSRMSQPLKWRRFSIVIFPIAFNDTNMSDAVDPKAFRNLCDMTIDNMYELAAIGDLLENKGLMTKQEILTLAKDLKQKSITPDPSSTSQLDEHRFTETENAVIEELMAVILRHKLSADHAQTLLGRTIQLLEWGKQAGHEMPEANA